MARGSTTAEIQSRNKANTSSYLNSQLKKLQDKLNKATTTKEKQRIRQSISSLKNRLGKKPKKDFIKSKIKEVKTSRGTKVRPKVETKNKLKINKVDPKQFDNRKKLKVSSEAKQDLKDQSSDAFGGKLPKQKLKIKPSEEAKQDLKDQASDKFGGKLPNKKKVEKKEVKKNPLDKYRRTKGEGIEGKSKGYRGDTKITKNLKKAGFTETRLAKLRKKNAAFQKAKKGGKKAMAEYRKKYPKRG